MAIERPIIFSGAMVRAVLDGRKTQTRRVLRPQPNEKLADTVHYDRATGGAMWASVRGDHGTHCPYGKPGGQLWIRETFFWGSGQPIYRADGAPYVGKWTPAIHMPRTACRLVLEVSNVRVERLQNICIADVDAEGLDPYISSGLLTAADRIDAKPEHWIGGSDEGISYCRACAQKRIKELTAAHPAEEFTLDGGWRTESDSQAFCDTCQCYLDNGFTDYACGSELEHFDANGFDVHNPSDCLSLHNIIGASLWKGGKHSDRMRRLCYRALWDSLNAKRGVGWSTNPWVWVVEFKRVGEALKAAA